MPLTVSPGPIFGTSTAKRAPFTAVRPARIQCTRRPVGRPLVAFAHIGVTPATARVRPRPQNPSNMSNSNEIAAALNRREGVYAAVEVCIGEARPDVVAHFPDGQAIAIEVVVSHRPEFSVVQALAPSLM